MPGVNNRNYLTQFKDLSRTLNLLATDTPTTVGADFLAGRAGYTIYILRIVVHVRTAAAQTITFQDDASTPFPVAILPASAAVGDQHVLIDVQDGPGIPLTEGKNLDIVGGVAGVAATISIVAYLRPTGVLTGGKRTTTTV